MRTPSYSERRLYRRIACSIPFDAERTILDLSLGGAMVSGKPFAQAETNINFTLPSSSKHIRVKVRVVHSPPSSGRIGFGVQFIDLDLDTKRALQPFLLEIENEDSRAQLDLWKRQVDETKTILNDIELSLEDVALEFKGMLSDFRFYLQSLKKHFLNMQALNQDRGIGIENVSDIFEEEFLRQVHSFILKLNTFAHGLSKERANRYRVYFQSLLLDLTNESAFFKRALEKPFKYAGDFIMMNLLYEGQKVGNTPWSRIVNSCLTSIPLGQAVRNRAWYLKEHILKVASDAKYSQEGTGRPKIMSFACGPCEEIRLSLRDLPNLSAEFYLLDQDEQALKYAEEALTQTATDSSRTNFNFINDSVRRFIKDPAHADRFPKMAFIYSAGLYDYLNQETAKKLTEVLYGMLEPGGIMVVGNFIEGNPFGHFIEYAADWFLIYRSLNEMLDLAPADIAEENRWLEFEQSGVNLFLCLRKPST